jgi:hypothetical protein
VALPPLHTHGPARKVGHAVKMPPLRKMLRRLPLRGRNCPSRRFVASLQPSVEASLQAIAADIARVSDPSLPRPLRDAINRRRRAFRNGTLRGEKKGRMRTTSSVPGPCS